MKDEKKYVLVTKWSGIKGKELVQRAKYLVNDLQTKTQHREFRELLFTTYPKLIHKPYITLLTYIIRGTMRDKEKNLLIPQELLAAMEGKENLIFKGNYVAKRFLESFSHDIAPLSYSDWSHTERKVRVLFSIDLHPLVASALQQERKQMFNKKDRVYLISGKPFSTKKQDNTIRYLKNEAQTVPHLKNKELFDYVHQIPTRIFTEMLERNGKKALQLALSMDDDQQLRILGNISDQPYQFYQEVEKSYRAFSVGEHIANMATPVRKVLTEHWIECDIKSAQLAIIARLWEIPYIEEFLAQGGSVWEYFYESFGLTKEAKPVLKTALYALCFGAAQKTIKEELEPLGTQIQNSYFKDPMIKEIIKGRRKQITKILRERGAFDCKGRFISLAGISVLSILSQQAQAMEYELLRPIFESASINSGRNGFTLALYQFDGFSFIPNRQENREKWIKKLKALLKQQAEHLGVITELEIKE